MLPAELPGGVYTLTAYTSRMRNDPSENLYSQNIIISSLSHEFPDTLYIPVLNRQEAFSQVFQETNQDLDKVVNEINTINAEIAKLETLLEQAGAPYTPGRMPSIKRP